MRDSDPGAFVFDLSQPWQSSRFASFDLETTGTEAGVDRIIEIGIVVFDGGEVVDRYQQLVDPEMELPPVITEVTGIKADDLVGQPKLAEVIDEAMARLTAQPILAYNHEFDTRMLRGELQRLGRGDELPPCLDPFPFCWEHLREKGLTKNAQLGTISEFMAIPLDAAHRADHDAEAAGRVMLKLPEYVLLPDSLEQLLSLQAALMQKVNERFARFRRNKPNAGGVLSGDDVRIELGAAYIYGDETDPIRALFSRIPDVRDLR
jgi:DNA polymerase III alpha subunit (gram-positive type)